MSSGCAANTALGATPLREVCSKLSSLELAVAVGQRGFRVALVSIENLLDITRTRAWIEGAALRVAIAAGATDIGRRRSSPPHTA